MMTTLIAFFREEEISLFDSEISNHTHCRNIPPSCSEDKEFYKMEKYRREKVNHNVGKRRCRRYTYKNDK